MCRTFHRLACVVPITSRPLPRPRTSRNAHTLLHASHVRTKQLSCLILSKLHPKPLLNRSPHFSPKTKVYHLVEHHAELCVQKCAQRTLVARVHPVAGLLGEVVALRPAGQLSGHETLDGWEGTHLTGEDSQICLFGGCLLITYLPCVPRSSVSTPLCVGRRPSV